MTNVKLKKKITQTNITLHFFNCLDPENEGSKLKKKNADVRHVSRVLKIRKTHSFCFLFCSPVEQC